MNTRRRFLRNASLSVGGAFFLADKKPIAFLQNSKEQTMPPIQETRSVDAEALTAATSPWASVHLVDSNKIPLPRGQFGRKLLFENKDTHSTLTILYTGIGVPGAYVHYHTFHEWAYNLAGDFTNNESTSPHEHMGPLQRFREGDFLDRPPYSLHGGERGREEFMQSQVGAEILIMEEGDVRAGTHSVEPQAEDFNPNYKDIKQWSVPRIIDTISGMPWEADPDVDGLKVKWLVDDQVRGFRAKLYWLPAGWKASQSVAFSKPYYYKQAHQFNFIITGDMYMQPYKSPGQTADKFLATKRLLVYRPPMSILGLANDVVTEYGCYWIEVTYGKGTEINNVPIEDPTFV